MTYRTQRLTLPLMSDARLYLKKLGVCCLLAALPFSNLKAADTNNNTPADVPPQESSVSNEALRAYLQLQEQLHATQLAIERSRQEDQAAAAQDSMALSNHLQAIEQSLVVQRAGELADNHLLLPFPTLRTIVASGFVRGLCTGLGVLNVWIGFWEAIQYREE